MAQGNQKRQKQFELALASKPGRSVPRSLRKGRVSKEYGGEDHGTKYRKNEKRPFDAEKSLHITMRSKYARGEFSMLHPKHSKHIKLIVFRAGRRHYVEVKKFVNVGNHLHLHVQTKSRKSIIARGHLSAFLREIGGLTARVVTGAKKGQPSRLKTTATQDALVNIQNSQKRRGPGRPSSPMGHVQRRKFWDSLVWTRVVSSWSELKQLATYLRKNEVDACNVVANAAWPEACLDFSPPPV